VKDCDGKFDELFKEMTKEKNKLAKQHLAELEELDQEWKEICNQLESVTLIHSDLFYIAWRISSALERGRATTLQEAINIAIDDERLAREEAARQAEARRQEAILQRQAEDNRRHNEAVERAAREEARRAEQEARDQAYRAEREARDKERAAEARCLACVNRNKCSYTVKKNSLSCSAFCPK
jgi:translation initiation factor IF-2